MAARTVLVTGLTPAGLDRLGLAVFTLLLLAMSDEKPGNRVRLSSKVQDVYRLPAGGWPWRATRSSTPCAARGLGACAFSVMTLSSRAKASSCALRCGVSDRSGMRAAARASGVQPPWR